MLTFQGRRFSVRAKLPRDSPSFRNIIHTHLFVSFNESDSKTNSEQVGTAHTMLYIMSARERYFSLERFGILQCTKQLVMF
jgi:hypothetical protein